MSTRRKSSRSESEYVENQSGWRFLFFSISIACIAGLAFRLYFSPTTIKSWVLQVMASQNTKLDVRFDTARLSLSRGAIPQLAIVLTHVEDVPEARCLTEPSVRIAELRIPVNVASLLSGHPTLGIVAGEDLMIDLDGIKRRCPSLTVSADRPRKPIAAHPPTKPSSSSESTEAPTKPAAATSDAPGVVWWRSEQLGALKKLVAGFDLSRVELRYEKKTKYIYLESFSVRSGGGEDSIRVSTDLLIPPEVSFGEEIPPLSIEADAKPTSASVRISATLNEGKLQAFAFLAPAADGELEIDARLNVTNAPLSTLVPLLSKAGLAKETFQPKFVWLDCEASIRGNFQRLFREHPLHLANCALAGNVGRIQLDAATRQPDGRWEPFSVRFAQVDLRRFLETFGAKGPDGVANDFGRLSGRLEMRSESDAHFEGMLERAQIRFSSRSVRAVQNVIRMGAKFDLRGERMTGVIDRVRLDQGIFAGSLVFDLDRELRSGDVKLNVEELKLDPIVQKVLVGGAIGSLTGQGEARIGEGHLLSVKGDWSVAEVDGIDYRIGEALFKTEFDADSATRDKVAGTLSHAFGDKLSGQFNDPLRDPTGGQPSGQFQVTLRAPLIEIHRGSNLFEAIRPLFFGHEFGVEWIPIREAVIHAVVSDRSGLRWNRGHGLMEEGKIQLSSVGALSRDRRLTGWVSIDYPLFKRLKWKLAGGSSRPLFVDDSKSLEDLRRRPRVDDAVLGLPMRKPMEPAGSVAARTTKSLRELGQKVIEKARQIVPGIDGPTDLETVPAAAAVAPATGTKSGE